MSNLITVNENNALFPVCFGDGSGTVVPEVVENITRELSPILNTDNETVLDYLLGLLDFDALIAGEGDVLTGVEVGVIVSRYPTGSTVISGLNQQVTDWVYMSVDSMFASVAASVIQDFVEYLYQVGKLEHETLSAAVEAGFVTSRKLNRALQEFNDNLLAEAVEEV